MLGEAGEVNMRHHRTEVFNVHYKLFEWGGLRKLAVEFPLLGTLGILHVFEIISGILYSLRQAKRS